MTNSAKDKEHEELLALYADAGRNIDNFKKDIRTYLVYYSAIAAAIITAHEQPPYGRIPQGLLFWFLIGACVCRFLIWDIYSIRIQDRRRTLRRVFRRLSKTFKWCRNPNDLDLKGVTDRGCSDCLVYHLQLLYPFIVFAVTWVWLLYPMNSWGHLYWPQILWLSVVTIGLDFIFLNSRWRYFLSLNKGFLVVVRRKLRITKSKGKNKFSVTAKIVIGTLILFGVSIPILLLAYFQCPPIHYCICILV